MEDMHAQKRHPWGDKRRPTQALLSMQVSAREYRVRNTGAGGTPAYTELEERRGQWPHAMHCKHGT